MFVHSRETLRIVLLTLICCVAGNAVAQTTRDSLASSFKNPPNSAQPRVWWYWLNGNVTQEGITADLEWMKRTKIGGFQLWDGNMGVPVFVDKPLIWMTPSWKAALRHAAAEANRLHLKMGMGVGGGWSETGGPWVKPEQGMKKYVWSETRVHGPRQFRGILPHPPTADGPFQDVNNTKLILGFHFPTPTDLPREKPQNPASLPETLPSFYRDTAVVAYKLPDNDVRMADLHPTITSSAGKIDGPTLMDGNLQETITLPIAKDANSGWIQFAFAKPFLAQAVSIATGPVSNIGGGGIPEGEVQASQNGTNWKTLVNLPGSPAQLSVRTFSFAPTTARFYRIVLKARAVYPVLASVGIPQSRNPEISEIELYSTPRVNYWEDKAAFGVLVNEPNIATPPAATSQTISRKEVLNLTSKMRSDGTLDWQVPEGRWIVLRLGYSLTGEINHPATPAATGLEVDKLSQRDVNSYFQQYVTMISDVAGLYFGKNFDSFTWIAGRPVRRTGPRTCFSSSANAAATI